VDLVVPDEVTRGPSSYPAGGRRSKTPLVPRTKGSEERFPARGRLSDDEGKAQAACKEKVSRTGRALYPPFQPAAQGENSRKLTGEMQRELCRSNREI